VSTRFAIPWLVTLLACRSSYPVEGPDIPPPGCLQGEAGESCNCPGGASFCWAGLPFNITCVDDVWKQTDASCDPSSVPLVLSEDASRQENSD